MKLFYGHWEYIKHIESTAQFHENADMYNLQITNFVSWFNILIFLWAHVLEKISEDNKLEELKPYFWFILT